MGQRVTSGQLGRESNALVLLVVDDIPRGKVLLRKVTNPTGGRFRLSSHPSMDYHLCGRVQEWSLLESVPDSALPAGAMEVDDQGRYFYRCEAPLDYSCKASVETDIDEADTSVPREKEIEAVNSIVGREAVQEGDRISPSANIRAPGAQIVAQNSRSILGPLAFRQVLKISATQSADSGAGVIIRREMTLFHRNNHHLIPWKEVLEEMLPAGANAESKGQQKMRMVIRVCGADGEGYDFENGDDDEVLEASVNGKGRLTVN